MTDTEKGLLLRGVLDNPDDDTARLVYADWMSENGQADRGEFVRVQVALARHPARRLNPDATYGEYADLRRRERELLTAANALAWGPSRALWDAGLETPTCNLNYCRPPGYVGLEFVRGFVGRAACTLAEFAGGPCGCRVSNGGRAVEAVASYGTPYCRVCGGTGEFPGIAPALFAREPVTDVTLTDEGLVWQSGFDWVAGGGADTYLHYEIWNRYRAAGPHPTREDALRALSRACVGYGRSIAEGWTHEAPCPSCGGNKTVVFFRGPGATNPNRRNCPGCTPKTEGAEPTGVTTRSGLAPLPPEKG